MDYVLEVFTQAVASTDLCRTAFSVLVPLLLSIVLGTLFVPRVLLLSRKRKLYDIPDQRKVHNRPIPRLGGVTFFPVLLISFCLTVGLWMLLELYSNPSHVDAYFPRFILLSVGMMALFLTGVADDLIGVSYQSKFLVQFLAAVLFPASGLWIHDLSGLFWLHEIPAWFGMPLTVILVVYIINAVNLIDGIDGLASGLCSISLLTLGAAAAIKGQYLFCMLSFGVWQCRQRQEDLYGRHGQPDVRLSAEFPAGLYVESRHRQLPARHATDGHLDHDDPLNGYSTRDAQTYP